MARLRLLAFAVLAAASPSPAVAQDSQKFADLGTCTTVRGEVIRDCRMGYRTFGRLNARRDNAVLVPTWHGGRSETMTFILGPDRWVDTTRWFAILIDKPGNGVSISPSNSRSQPGRHFPRLTFADLVAAEHRVVTEHLGIRRLHAVVGWSMGGMQAIEYALRFPEAVDRIVSVAGTPRRLRRCRSRGRPAPGRPHPRAQWGRLRLLRQLSEALRGAAGRRAHFRPRVT